MDYCFTVSISCIMMIPKTAVQDRMFTLVVQKVVRKAVRKFQDDCFMPFLEDS